MYAPISAVSFKLLYTCNLRQSALNYMYILTFIFVCIVQVISDQSFTNPLELQSMYMYFCEILTNKMVFI